MQRIAIVVSPQYRDLDSIQKYVSRLRGPYIILLRTPANKGEVLARMTAQRKGFQLEEFEPYWTSPKLAGIIQRVRLVDAADRVVVFAASADLAAEHTANLANAKDKPLTHFKEF